MTVNIKSIFLLTRYYIGQQAYILITDLDMLKQIMVKDFDNFSDHAVSCYGSKRTYCDRLD